MPALVALVLLAVLAPSAAAADRPFAQRFAATDTGDLALVGNTVLTCPNSTTCTNAQNGTTTGTHAENGGFDMARVDVDSDGSTQTSSSATVSLPSGATVLWAGLYWGGKSSAADAQRHAVKLRTPTAPAYTDLIADQFDTLTADATIYQGFENVTTAVRAAGAGSYTVGGVRADTGTSLYGGWALLVAYRDPAAARHNLVVLDGFKQLSTAAPSLNVTATGLTAPASGTVKADLGIVAYDGDRGRTGDGMRLQGTSVSGPLNPVDNVFNSTIGRRGTRITAKNPDYVDQLGFDADTITANGVLPPGATTASLDLARGNGNDTYMPGVLSLVSDSEVDPPETTITSGPAGATNDTTPTFALASDETGSTFECRVDAGAWAACTSPFTTAALAQGAHTF